MLCLTQLHTLFEDVPPSWLAAFKTVRGANSRHCIYTPLVTFWAFLAQVLDPDGSCRRAVTRVQTLCSVLGLALPREGRRIVVMDGTSIRMPDSKDNAAECS